jgi:hypothetical protein
MGILGKFINVSDNTEKASKIASKLLRTKAGKKVAEKSETVLDAAIDKYNNTIAKPSAQNGKKFLPAKKIDREELHGFTEKAVNTTGKVIQDLGTASTILKIIIRSIVLLALLIIALIATFISNLIVRFFPAVTLEHMNTVKMWIYIVLGIVALLCAVSLVLQCLGLRKDKKKRGQ